MMLTFGINPKYRFILCSTALCLMFSLLTSDAHAGWKDMLEKAGKVVTEAADNVVTETVEKVTNETVKKVRGVSVPPKPKQEEKQKESTAVKSKMPTQKQKVNVTSPAPPPIPTPTQQRGTASAVIPAPTPAKAGASDFPAGEDYMPIGFSPEAYAESDQERTLKFSVAGMSLSMSPEEISSSIEGDGYQLESERSMSRGQYKYAYRRKTDKMSYRVELREQDGVVNTINFNESLSQKEMIRLQQARRAQKKKDRLANGGKKVRRKRNTQKTQSAQALDDKLSRIKEKFGYEDEELRCSTNMKGGGKCTGSFRSDTHSNRISLSVSPTSTAIFISATPLAENIVARNKKKSEVLNSAFSCFKTTNINSVQEIFECMQLSLSFNPEDKYRSGNWLRSLDSDRITCGQMTNFYETALESLGKDTSEVPSCKTFADVVELSRGKPPIWSGCVEPRDDAEFFKNCVGGQSPSLVSPKGSAVPSCNSLLRTYKKGIAAAQPNMRLSMKDISLPDCDFVLSAAKSWRGELPASIKGCDGYDPNNTADHLVECLSSEREIMYLQNCAQVRAAYKRNVTKANGGRKPEKFVDVPCEETEVVLARAGEVREKRQKQIVEIKRKQTEAKQKARQREQNWLNAIKDRMAQKYKDTPEGIKSRTSPYEKQIKANGGKAPKSCSSPKINGFYCPPTNEEIRLAMMRRHADKTGFKIVNGHLLYGKKATAATVLLDMTGNGGGRGMLGVELRYDEPELVYDCDQKRTNYECTFRLPFSTRYDELTKMNMDQMTSGSSFNVNNFIYKMLDTAVSSEDHSFEFRLDRSGLWRAKPTAEQMLEDLESSVRYR